jgi:TRAP-type C4-dicarboxylate transport system permease small subunit
VVAVDHGYVRLMDKLYAASVWAAGAAITLMCVIIPWGVFTRYALGTGSRWPEPIAILLMMVFTFIGAAAAYRANAHIAVTMLTDRLPRALQAFAERIVDLLMVLACGFVAWYGGRLVLGTMGQSVAELPWLPVGITYASLPIGSAVTLLFVLERVVFGPQHERPLVRYEESPTPEAEAAS